MVEGGGQRRILYGRRRGHRLRAARQKLVAELLPRLRVADTASALDIGDPRRLFVGPVRSVWLEVGFGAGEHLAAQAEAHPDIGFIGCEPFRNGVAALLSVIAGGGLANIRIHDDDARPLLDALPQACLGRVFILFPDPWPKRRHHRRRFISDRSLDVLARILEDGAELRLATDHAEYARWCLHLALRHPAFEWAARRPADWRRRPDDWPATRYERKAREQGRASIYLRFLRRPRAGLFA